MNRRIGMLFLALGSLGLVAHGQSPQSPQPVPAATHNVAADTVDVQHVIDAYHAAVLAHDGERLASLFLAQGSTWINVLSDDAYARVNAKSPHATRVRVGSYTDFAKLVSSSKASLNPTHTDMTIHGDGTVASVYFDFVFLIDGKETNRGSETWVLVKSDDGWRISDITYSSNPRM
jgi:ketosteroid isomerase-like protein